LKTHPRCAPCLLSRVQFEAELSTKDVALQKKAIQAGIEVLRKYMADGAPATHLSTKIHREAYRVLKPAGVIAFTDWIQTGNMTDKEWIELNAFMAFPYMETLDGYEQILRETGFMMLEKEDLQDPDPQDGRQNGIGFSGNPDRPSPLLICR